MRGLGGVSSGRMQCVSMCKGPGLSTKPPPAGGTFHKQWSNAVDVSSLFHPL